MKPSIKKTLLQKAIDQEFDVLRTQDPSTTKYKDSMERFIKLHKLRAEMQRPGVSPDTIVLAVTNIVGILLVLKYEQLGIITTKALSIAQKVR